MAKKVDDDELEIDDLAFLAENSQKKKVNSKKKGNRGELTLTKILGDHFGQTFSRSLGSGNRWGQVSNLPEHAKETLLGDICAPKGFRWVIEAKNGYEDVMDLTGVVAGKECKQLDKFIAQSSHDNEQSGRSPIIMWKAARKPWITFVRDQDFPPNIDFAARLHYKGWVGVSLDELLKKTDTGFWFAE
jgi:hypothetical protein